jgi:hypothetical protein
VKPNPNFHGSPARGPNVPAITGIGDPQEGACHGVATAFRSPVPGEGWCRHHRLERRARHATAPILSDNLAPFEGNGVSTIILDLQDLTFIDSTGMHVFLEARRRAMSNGH